MIPNDLTFALLQDGGEAFKRVDEIDANDTIIGYLERTNNGTSPRHTGSTSSAIWRLVRITKSVNVTTRTYPGGIDDYIYVWDNRNNGTYTYQ
ncbi:MAG: hypothetical protein AABY22_09295 [Nanoarchaeota archaeon]